MDVKQMHLVALFFTLCGATFAAEIVLWSEKLTTSSINVRWSTTGGNSTKHRVGYVQIGGDTMMVSTDWIDNGQRTYKIRHLPADTKFHVCVTGQDPATLKEDNACRELTTIPVMLASSIIGLTLTIAYFVITIVFGCCWWRHKKTQFKKAQRDKLKDENRELNANMRNTSIEDQEVAALCTKDVNPSLVRYSPQMSVDGAEMFGTRV